MIENLKEKAIERIKQRCKLSESYNEGLIDGFIEGYEAALKDTQVIITKYNLGKEPTETSFTLRPAKRFLKQPIGEMIDKVVAWFRESKDNNIIYTYHNDEENKDVYMVALRDDDKNLIGYYEKHEYRNKETAGLYDFKKN